MHDRLRADLLTAMKARDAVAVSAIRSALAAIGNAEAVDTPAIPAPDGGGPHFAGSRPGLGAAEAPRRALSEAEVDAILRGQIDERRAAASGYERLGDTERAARLREEAEVLAPYVSNPTDGEDQPAEDDSGGVQSARRPKNAR